ncbi:MAG: glycosyltransferase family 9 protein [Pseudomonadota bacterium]|nr:glycosyltransferase family 9 protein [Pseudomonadota bacterium]
MERAHLLAGTRAVIDHSRVLVHLATGIGNIVLATPLLLALRQRFGAIDLLLHPDYAGVAELFRGWSALGSVFDGRAGERPSGAYDVLVPAIPPFAWPRFAAHYRGRGNAVVRPPDALFYQDEQGYYLAFAEQLGWRPDRRPDCFLPVAPAGIAGVTAETLILAPGCKTGQMAKKRWPHFLALAALFPDVVIIGTEDDLLFANGAPMRFPEHVRSLIGNLSLKELAGVLAACGAVVANDSGIGHIAAAVGVPTILVFGPTPDKALGTLPSNATVLRQGLACEPCWFGNRFAACGGRITCLRELSATRVTAALRAASLTLRARVTESSYDL